MKNVFTSFTLLVIIFLCFSVSETFAQEMTQKNDEAFYSDFYVMQVKPMKFKVSYSWPMSDRVEIRILDGAKKLIFHELVLVYKKYHKIFDLSIFADGQYTFELFDGDKKFNQSFDVTTVTTRTATASKNMIAQESTF